MGRATGKIALITGAARDPGRSHAIALADAAYPLAGADDLARTAELVEDLDRRIVARQADVRSLDSLTAALDEGMAELGRLDIVSANAGILSSGALDELSPRAWREMIDVNLSGVWRTCRTAIPHLIAGGRGGSIILTSSVAGLKAYRLAHYVAAKHGVTGLTRALAVELAPHRIRVNSVHRTRDQGRSAGQGAGPGRRGARRQQPHRPARRAAPG